MMGNFNVQNSDWLEASKTDSQERPEEIFPVTNELANLIHDIIFFPRVPRVTSNLFDLF